MELITEHAGDFSEERCLAYSGFSQKLNANFLLRYVADDIDCAVYRPADSARKTYDISVAVTYP